MYVSPTSSRFWFGRFTPAMRATSGSPRGHGGCPGRPHQATQGRRERSWWLPRARPRTRQRAACGRAGGREETHLTLPLLVTGVGADDHGRAVPLDHAAAFAHWLDRRAYFHLIGA